jgi:MFS family permease
MGDPQSAQVPISVPNAASTVPWYRTITRDQWRVLLAAKLGWMLDAFDFMIYTMAIGRLMAYFKFDKGTAGLLGTTTLLVSAVGGLLFGVIADRIGRTRALMATILIFSFCSLGAATSQDWIQLLLWRALLGIGMGGEWASGAVLVSETWPAQHRTKASSLMQSGWALGYILAAVVAALVLNVLDLGPNAWRWLFAVGVLPALIVLWFRRSVPEPPVWVRRRTGAMPHTNPIGVLFGPRLWLRTVLAILLTSAVQFGYWGLFFWLPPFLEKAAGMQLVNALGWIIPLQLGAYAGYLSFGFIADRFGRQLTFVVFLVGAAVIVPIYGQLADVPWALFVLSPLLGFVGHGYFSLFGVFLAELFPTSVRATGQGLTYNCGRAMGALGPVTIGVLSEVPQVGVGSALALTSAFFLLGAVLIFSLPDTTGVALEDGTS